MQKAVIYTLASILLGFVSAAALGEYDDGETIILAAIFWLLASIHYRMIKRN
ncbi:MAG: hypothetical protein AB1402_04730 [Bacillota bacterium]